MAEAKARTTKPKATKAKKATTRARKPKAAAAKTLKVKQVRSGSGHAETYRRTLRALGLRHHQHEIVVNDTPGVRGMLRKVHHLVRVEEA